jgi:hypothetical protein
MDAHVPQHIPHMPSAPPLPPLIYDEEEEKEEEDGEDDRHEDNAPGFGALQSSSARFRNDHRRRRQR